MVDGQAIWGESAGGWEVNDWSVGLDQWSGCGRTIGGECWAETEREFERRNGRDE